MLTKVEGETLSSKTSYYFLFAKIRVHSGLETTSVHNVKKNIACAGFNPGTFRISKVRHTAMLLRIFFNMQNFGFCVKTVLLYCLTLSEKNTKLNLSCEKAS